MSEEKELEKLIVECGAWESAVYAVCSEEVKDIIPIAEEILKTSKDNIDFSFNESTTGTCLIHPDYSETIIWMNKAKIVRKLNGAIERMEEGDIEKMMLCISEVNSWIQHEAVHAAHQILKQRGYQGLHVCDEPLTYLAQYIAGHISGYIFNLFASDWNNHEDPNQQKLDLKI